MNDIDYTTSYSKFIDYAKALGIISVLVGHYYSPPTPIYNPYMYHMPLFFFIGGMLFKPNKSYVLTLKSVATKHLGYTAIIFVLIGALTNALSSYSGVAFYNVLDWNPVNMVINALQSNMHNNRLFLVAWFMIAFASVTLIAPIIFMLCNMLNSKVSQSLFLTVGVVVGLCAMHYLPSMYSQTKSQAVNFACQISVGLMFYAVGFFSKRTIYENANAVTAFILFCITLYFVKEKMLFMSVMAWSKYNNGVIMSVFGALSGIYMVMFFAKTLSISSSQKIILHIGRNTKTIMSWHLLVYFIVDLTLSKIGIYDIIEYNKKGYHVFNAPELWGVYVTAGVLVPLAFLSLKEKIINSYR